MAPKNAMELKGKHLNRYAFPCALELNEENLLAFSIFTNTMTDYYPSPQVRAMVLTGDDNTPSIPPTEAEVNHLADYSRGCAANGCVDPDMQRGYPAGGV